MVKIHLNCMLPYAAARLLVATGFMYLGGLASGPTFAAALQNTAGHSLQALNSSQPAPTDGAIDATKTMPLVAATDDHANIQADATLLRASSDGSDSRLIGTGQIDAPGDADMFHFFTGDGSFSIEVSPTTEQPTQQSLLVALYDKQGSLVATVSPNPGRPAVLGGRLKAGQYYLLVNVADRSAATTSDAGQHAGPRHYSVGGIVPHPGALGAPEALALADYEVGPAPRPVKFDGTGIQPMAHDIVSWRWDFGDGNSAVGATASHTYAAAGTFTATLTITDRQGHTDTNSVAIAVDEPGPAFTPAVTGIDIRPAQTAAAEAQRSELAINTSNWAR